MIGFGEIGVGADATAGVWLVVGVVHTVVGARLVVVSVHVGHGGQDLKEMRLRKVAHTRCWRV